MINPDKVGVGDFVEVTEAFKEYGKVGDVYRLLDSRVPKEPTSAIGWKVDLGSGKIDLTQAYKLPHDKVSLASRKKIAESLRGMLAQAKQRVVAAEREYNLVKGRVDGLLNYDSKESEVKAVMDRTFYWL